MKKILVFSTALLFFSSVAFAGPFDSFTNTLNNTTRSQAQRYLDAFARDFGQAISGGGYGIGMNLGALGIYLSAKMSYQDVSSDNKIVDDSGSSSIFFPILQGEIGLPYKFDAIVRLSYLNDTTILGGGLRYELIEGRNLVIPTVSLQSVYTHSFTDFDDVKFSAWNLKSGATAYFGQIPFVQPYLFLNYDITYLYDDSSRYSLKSDVYGFGYGIGANVSLGMLSLSLAVSLYDSQPNYNVGFFIGF